MRITFACVLLSLAVLNSNPTLAQEPVDTTICAVMRDPSAFAGRVVKLRATVQFGYEYSSIVDITQPDCGGPWFHHGFHHAPWKDSPDPRDGYDAEFQRLHPVFLVEDENMERFNSALRAVVYPRSDKVIFIDGDPRRYRVTATMTGRVDYAGEYGLGFGHLNGWRVRFVLSSVEDIATEELTYDWEQFSRDPVRFPHGTIRGKLTDKDGKPIKLAWVGAIPAEGPDPSCSHGPSRLTQDDGSYTLDLTPGKYFVAVSCDEPASEGVPVQTTYFPSSETKAGAAVLNVPDYTDLKDIDIQIHRSLTPHFFDVQVLGPDGKPAIGSYTYLTQTDKAPIAGGGLIYTDGEGRARLLAFQGLDYLLWAQLGSWPTQRCAPVVRLDRHHSDAEPVVVRISLSHEACSKQEDDARSAAYKTHRR